MNYEEYRKFYRDFENLAIAAEAVATSEAEAEGNWELFDVDYSCLTLVDINSNNYHYLDPEKIYPMVPTVEDWFVSGKFMLEKRSLIEYLKEKHSELF